MQQKLSVVLALFFLNLSVVSGHYVPRAAPGTQFITGPCQSDADCADGCCGFNSGKCAGAVIAQERDGGCGFGDAQPNNNAAQKIQGPNAEKPKAANGAASANGAAASGAAASASGANDASGAAGAADSGAAGAADSGAAGAADSGAAGAASGADSTSTGAAAASSGSASGNAAAGGDFKAANGQQAQQENDQFASLTADSACQDGQQACVQGAFAQCTGGKFATTQCAGGTVCASLPLVNKPGTSVTCTTEADRDARIKTALASREL